MGKTDRNNLNEHLQHVKYRIYCVDKGGSRNKIVITLFSALATHASLEASLRLPSHVNTHGIENKS